MDAVTAFLLCFSSKPINMGAVERLPPGTWEAPVAEETDRTKSITNGARCFCEFTMRLMRDFRVGDR